MRPGIAAAIGAGTLFATLYLGYAVTRGWDVPVWMAGLLWVAVVVGAWAATRTIVAGMVPSDDTGEGG